MQRPVTTRSLDLRADYHSGALHARKGTRPMRALGTGSAPCRRVVAQEPDSGVDVLRHDGVVCTPANEGHGTPDRRHEAAFERCGDNIRVYTAQESRTAPLRKFRAEELAQLVALALISSHVSTGDCRET